MLRSNAPLIDLPVAKSPLTVVTILRVAHGALAANPHQHRPAVAHQWG